MVRGRSDSKTPSTFVPRSSLQPTMTETPEDVREAARYVIERAFYGGAGAVDGPFGRREPLEWFMHRMRQRLKEIERERLLAE